MTSCNNCEFFNPVPKDADDYEAGKGDCVTEKADEKGRYWLSRPVFEGSASCKSYSKR
ncbi:benzylsuccinate synthase gamma subunit family protein [Magnetospirillum sp. 15-1]|uniref:Putative benzylsuccinate synthase gamma subunit n=1 Tax=Magnetospirillum sp. TS-6 TaxID=267349 RepID=I7FTF4_9PROT|nr:benzylsuccinate synthase gamma subunit family protein [Magnetospirillum sp. 15-1]BAD42365.1 putative benzylsuccinate synthase gamma subunit [Magnetospirillum sp. TS-6]